MKRISWYGTRKNDRDVLEIISLLLLMPTILRAQNTLGCPDLITSNKCTCYTFEDAIFFDCQDTITKNVNDALKSVSEIHSLSVFDLDDNEEALGPQFVPQGICIKHIHISRSNIKEIGDDTFMPLRKCLETLSIVSSKIKFLPQKALSGMLKLMSIDLMFNYIEDIPSYSFYGLPLMKLNMKGNMIREVSETAFFGLELSLTEIDLSENNLTIFPIQALMKLRHLRSLRFAWNEMSSFPVVGESDLISLEYLDLNSNNFEFISEDCLKFCPSLSFLSFHFNFISSIHYRAFHSLTNLKSLDLSHNRIKVLNSNLFQNNKVLEFIKLSHNHLHHIHGLFCNMPSLIELHLSYNNILDVPIDSLISSSRLRKLHLDRNCINNIHSESFSDLKYLEMLHLEFNYLTEVPHSIFINNRNLLNLRLDNNNFSDFINDTLGSLENLTEIRCNNNKLKLITKNNFINSLKVEEIHLDHNNIRFIEAGAFIKMTNLKFLSLHHNQLIDINDVLPKIDSNLLTLHLDSNHLLSANHFMFQSQKSLSHLSLKHNRFKYLTRTTLRNLTQLVRLELRGNEFSIIDDFSFQQLNSVRYLDLQRNLLRNITNYTFFGLVEVEDLDVSHNKIKYIHGLAFDSLKKLRSLNLSFNPLKNLHQNIFQQGLPLSSLNLDNCDIELIENGTFYGLNNLKLLSLKNNSLKSSDLLSIDVSGLKHLVISYNVLDYLPLESFYQLPLLEILLMEHCNIEYISEGTFSFNKNLKKLNLAQNIISKIPERLFDIDNSISELNVSNNFLDFVPYNTLYNLSQIETLDIADNLLPRIEISGLEKLTKLKHLILKKNDIKLLTSRKKVIFAELILFDISHNRLTSLPTVIFAVFPNLQNINISNNDILQFNFLVSYKRIGITLLNMDLSNNPANSLTTFNRLDNNTIITNIYELHISATNISSIDSMRLDLFTNLQHLYIKYNNIRRLSISPFSKLPFLENLDLSFNRITQLKTSNFRGLIKLRTLCLSYNNIESMESFADELSNLKLLDLSHNKLQNILNEDLIHLKELTVLYLSHNNIKYISATAFKNLNKISHVDLGHNKIHDMPMELLLSVENYIQGISIKGNVINCNCQKNNTWVWIENHPKIIKPTEVTCMNNEYPKEKCNIPVISQLSIDRHKDNSVSVSWFIRNRTAIKGIHIIYYEEDEQFEVGQVNLQYMEKADMSTHITNLKSNRNYIVCVVALHDDTLDEFLYNEESLGLNITGSKNRTKISQYEVAALLSRSPSSECASFNTFKKNVSLKLKPVKPFDLSLILNRRMGLIVGCSLGVVVFFIMVSILLYTKIRERKRIAKSEPVWAEMNDYHSLQSKEDVQSATAASTDNILLGMSKSRHTSFDHYKQS